MTLDIDAFNQDLIAWRRDLHAHPEFGFEEKRTSGFVAQKLREFGLDDVAEGVGGTGVVGTLKRGTSNRAGRACISLADRRHHACLRP